MGGTGWCVLYVLGWAGQSMGLASSPGCGESSSSASSPQPSSPTSRARAKALQSASGRNMHSLSQCVLNDLRPAALHSTHDLDLRGGLVPCCALGGKTALFVTLLYAFTSSMDFNSSSRDCKAIEISGFKDASVLLVNSAPYFCFTRAGRPGWVKWSHMYTTVFSRDGVISSSPSILTPWCVVLLWDVNRLSWKHLNVGTVFLVVHLVVDVSKIGLGSVHPCVEILSAILFCAIHHLMR